MPVEITRTPDGRVAVAYCFGILTGADVDESITFAFDSRHIEPSLDRIIMLAPDAELHLLDIEALRRIQRRVLERERHHGGAARFRSVLVHSSPAQKHLMKLYKAIWDALELPDVEFTIAASDAEAWEILDLAPFAYQRDAN